MKTEKNNFKMKGILTICIVFFFYSIILVKAQDIHFSQFAYAPLQINPAMTGVFEGKIRFANTYRSQWSGLGNGYKTIHISADAPIGRSNSRESHFGVGALLYQDKAGTAGYKATVVEGSLSYFTGLNELNESFFAMGFQAGLNQQSIDLEKATWDSQWNGDTYDPSLSSGESIQLQQFSYLDLNAGLLYYFIPDENNSFSIGAAMSHIGNPNSSFYLESETPLRTKITVHSGGEISVDNSYEMWAVPKLLFTVQGNQKEIIAGGYLKRKVHLKSMYTNYNKESFFYVGAFYRYQDAVSIAFRIEYNTLGLGISYDVNTSTLSKLAGSANAFEVNFSIVPYLERGGRPKKVNPIPRFF